MKTEKLLFKKLFLLALFVLLLNDFFLKYYFHNYITGKLSDFAGLFIFPYFISSFSGKRIKEIYILTGVLFVFWKSEFSQPIITFFNNYNFGVNRIVDYSDLVSLIVLPFSYTYRLTKSYNLKKDFNPIVRYVIICISCFSFIATSVQKEFGEINLKSDFKITSNNNTDTIKKELELYATSNNKYYCQIEIPKKRSRINFLIKIEKDENKNNIIKIDSILNFSTTGTLFGVNNNHVKYIKSLKAKDFEDLFLKQTIVNNVYVPL